MVASLTQAGRTRTFTLDPSDRIITETDTTGPTLTNHYADSSDSPAWLSFSDGTWTRNIEGPGGRLAATVTNTGTTELQITNLHGDIVATTTPTATDGPATCTETTEHGQTRDPTIASPRYAWLGAHRRSADTLAGLVLMGVRLYNPTTGRFLQTDPVPGGSANAYDYTNADPINGQDLDGKWCKPWKKKCRKKIKKKVKSAWRSAKRYGSKGYRWARRNAWKLGPMGLNTWLTIAAFSAFVGATVACYRGIRSWRRSSNGRRFNTAVECTGMLFTGGRAYKGIRGAFAR